MENNLLKKLNEISSHENDRLHLDKHRNPGDIYHYSSSNGLFSIINEDVLHLTSSGFMNDYSDGKYIRKTITKFCEENKDNYDEVFLESIKWYFRELTHIEIENDLCGVRFNNNYNYVFSLTFKKDSQNMWSNYSNHEGYCLKLNYQKLMECFNRAVCSYESKRQIVPTAG